MNAISIDRAKQHHFALLDEVIPFWGRQPVDQGHDGYTICLGRGGAAFGMDKSLRLQARYSSPTISFYIRGSQCTR